MEVGTRPLKRAVACMTLSGLFLDFIALWPTVSSLRTPKAYTKATPHSKPRRTGTLLPALRRLISQSSTSNTSVVKQYG